MVADAGLRRDARAAKEPDAQDRFGRLMEVPGTAGKDDGGSRPN
jgi:hypothetical protein